MAIPFYHVDAFTSEVFRGNPAGVCLLKEWPDDALLQAIAAENSLPETAFLVAGGHEQYAIRWFSPLVEIDLCGHATLASALVVLELLQPGLPTVRFFSPRSGELTVTRQDGLLVMDFPAQPPEPCQMPERLRQALGRQPSEVMRSQDYVLVFETEEEIRAMEPDFSALAELDLRGVIVTAPGETVDFVSRFFAPGIGINEDPVTGSAHCALVPYWRKRLNKDRFHAFQLSARGGELWCEDQGGRIAIAGRAVLYLRGMISL